MRNRFVILIAIGVMALLWLASKCASQTPAGLYTLRDLAWEGPGTNWQVLVRLDTNALPIASIESRTNRSAISNLTFNTTYWLSMRAQSNGNWSAESEPYKWPHDREDYFATRNYSQATIGGTKIVLPLTLVVTTNVITKAMWGFVGVEAWTSNNISPYIFPQ